MPLALTDPGKAGFSQHSDRRTDPE